MRTRKIGNPLFVFHNEILLLHPLLSVALSIFLSFVADYAQKFTLGYVCVT